METSNGDFYKSFLASIIYTTHSVCIDSQKKSPCNSAEAINQTRYVSYALSNSSACSAADFCFVFAETTVVIL